MSEPKFTPGPWECRESYVDCCGYEVYDTSGQCGIVAGEYGISEKSDAILIAAAPEMYAMLDKCKNILDGQEYSREIDRLTGEIDKLLKKARGEK